MKTGRALLGLAMTMVLMVHASETSAQRHRDGRGNKGRNERAQDQRNAHDTNDHHYADRRASHHRDDHHQHYRPRPVVIHHHAPRYVYYSDYNMYYDCHRSTYIVLSGRRWVVVSQRPDVLRRVDLNYAYHTNVDYYDDDLPGYLGR